MKTFTRTVALTLGLVFVSSSFPTTCKAETYEDKAGAMITDTLVYRPAGVVLTVTGAALFVVMLPFTAIAGGTKETAKTLVKTPYKFTFRRPIGTDLKEYMD